MDVISVKIVAGFLFFVLAMLFGWTPYWCLGRCLRHTRHVGSEQPVLVRYLHSLGSGVLMSTCLLYLLPESLEAVNEAIASTRRKQNISQTNSSKTSLEEAARAVPGEADEDHYPVAELLVAVGFLFIYMLDTVIKTVGKSDTTTSCSSSAASHQQVLNDRNKHTTWKDCDNAGTQASENFEMMFPHKFSLHWLKLKFSRSGSARTYQRVEETERGLLGDEITQNTDASLFNTASDDVTFTQPSSSQVDTDPRDQTVHASTKSSQFRSLALVAALCIHGFFDGVMLGLQTSLTAILSLLFAISLHKCFVAVGLSLSLISNANKRQSSTVMLLYVFMFAAVAPLGVLVSATFLHHTLSASDNGASSVSQGCLQAFSVGTFMFVCFSETTEGQHKALPAAVVQLVFLLAGFALMAGLRALLPHS